MPELPGGFEAADNGLLGFFSGLVDEGHSQASAIREFRAAGGHASNDVLRATYDFARDYAENRAEGWGLPVDQTIGFDSHQVWPTNGGQGYGYPVNVHVENLEGEQDMRRTMVYSEVPLSPEEVYNRAADQLLGDDSATQTANTAKVFGATAAGAPLQFIEL